MTDPTIAAIAEQLQQLSAKLDKLQNASRLRKPRTHRRVATTFTFRITYAGHALLLAYAERTGIAASEVVRAAVAAVVSPSIVEQHDTRPDILTRFRAPYRKPHTDTSVDMPARQEVVDRISAGIAATKHLIQGDAAVVERKRSPIANEGLSEKTGRRFIGASSSLAPNPGSGRGLKPR